MNNTEFKNRIISLLERAPKNRTFEILNSAFFLWIMSALLVGFGGSFFNAQSQCIVESEKLIAEAARMDSELSYRSFKMAVAAHNSDDAEVYQSSISDLKGILSKYQDTSTLDIYIEWQLFSIRVYTEVDRIFPVRDFSLVPNAHRIPVDHLIALKTGGKISEKSFEAYRSHVQRVENRSGVWSPIDFSGKFFLESKCNIIDVLRQMVFSERYILTAKKWPLSIPGSLFTPMGGDM
jgi:hypothetical protein